MSVRAVAALSAVYIAFFLARHLQRKDHIEHKYTGSFQSVAPSVYRFGFLWAVPGLPGVLADVHVSLVNVDGSYILIDVGAPPGQGYEKTLLKGLRKMVKDGSLFIRSLSCAPYFALVTYRHGMSIHTVLIV